MKDNSSSKKFDLISVKNIEEDEKRSEIIDTMYFDLNLASIKSIHNKRKDFR